MLGARLLPMQPTQHSKPPAFRVGGAPTRPSMGPVNTPVDTQGKRSHFLVFVMFQTENIRFQRYQNTGIYYDLRQPTDHALFTHLHHAICYPSAPNPEPCAVYSPAPNDRPMHKDWTRAAIGLDVLNVSRMSRYTEPCTAYPPTPCKPRIMSCLPICTKPRTMSYLPTFTLQTQNHVLFTHLPQI